MLIYNTTFLVSDRHYGPWIKWVREVHIPFMLDCGFKNPQIAKVLNTHKEQEGTSVSVQFHISDMYKLELWDEEFAEQIMTDLASRFGVDVLLFSTILEIL